MSKKVIKEDFLYTTAEIKDMFLRGSKDLKYTRINITMPLYLKERVARVFPDESRSRMITRLLIEAVEKKEKSQKLSDYNCN